MPRLTGWSAQPSGERPQAARPRSSVSPWRHRIAAAGSPQRSSRRSPARGLMRGLRRSSWKRLPALTAHTATLDSCGHRRACTYRWRVTPTPDPVSTPERRWPPPALRVRPFRWYWAAQWPTLLGTWMQVVALGYLVYQQTGSTTAVAVVAAADGIPSVILSLAGGVPPDRLPRRRVLLATHSVLGLSAGLLALLVATGHATFVAILIVAMVF